MSAPNHPHLRVVSITPEQVAKAIDDTRLDRDTAVRLLAKTSEEVARLREEVSRLRGVLQQTAYYARESERLEQSMEYRLLSAMAACREAQREVKP